MSKERKVLEVLLLFLLIMLFSAPEIIQAENQNLPPQVGSPRGEPTDSYQAPIFLDSLINIKINSDATTEIQNEEQVVVNPLNKGNVVAVWRDFRYGYRRVGVGYSLDGGTTWSDAIFDTAAVFPWHSDPGLTVDQYGNFYAVVLGIGPFPDQTEILVFKSSDGGISWSPPVVAVPPDTGRFEDKELMACDRTGGPFDGNLYIAWARYFDTYNQIFFTRSTDGGNSFEAPQKIGDLNQVQWAVPAVGPDGEVYVAWVGYSQQRALWLDKSTDGGVTFATDILVQPLSFGHIDINGGILTFAYPAMDVDISNSPYRGNIYITFADRGADGKLDMFFTRSTNGGNTWSSRIRINDDPMGNGVDQFHPWISVDQKGVISVIFYDRRNDPNNYLMDIYLTQSFDGGLTFTPNKRLTTVSSDPGAGSAFKTSRPFSLKMPAGLIGEYIGLSTWDSYLNAAWTDTREGNQDVYSTALRYYLPPSPFSLLTPLDQDSIFSESLTFSWEEATDTLPDRIVEYTLYLSRSVNFSSESTTVIPGISQNGLYVDTLKTGPLYYWKVKASDNYGMERWSNESRSFYRYLPGDANGDDKYSVSDVVYIINYLFKGGPSPSPLGAGDANCSLDVTVSDVIYLINYLFKGGPPPLCE